MRRLAAINQDLAVQQESLRAQETQEQAVKDQLEVKAADLQSKLNEAQQAANALQQAARPGDRGRGGRGQRELAERELEAERAQIRAAQVVTNVGAGQVIVTPIAGFACPVLGAAYSNDFGGARGHGGIDMFVPTGTPAVAVKSGSVSYVAERRCGREHRIPVGLGRQRLLLRPLLAVRGRCALGVAGRDHRAHGNDRQRSGPHLHFEIRVGGDNGVEAEPLSHAQRRRLLSREPTRMDDRQRTERTGTGSGRTSTRISSRRSIDELRLMHAECLELETEVSYVRRLTQARVDILEAETGRRERGESLEDLINSLPQILSDPGPRAAPATSRLPMQMAPAQESEWAPRLAAFEGTLTDLPGLSEDELSAAIRGFAGSSVRCPSSAARSSA